MGGKDGRLGNLLHVATFDRCLLIWTLEQAGDICVWMFCISGVIAINSWSPSSGVKLALQLYIAQRVSTMVPVMDEELEVHYKHDPPLPQPARARLTCLSSVFQGFALVAYVALYICFVSAVVDTMNVWSGRMPAWGSFWGSISPYSMLYTSGKCLNRLGALGTPVIVAALCYVVTRVRFASKKTVSSRMLLNVDFVVNRVIVASILTSYKSVGSACVFGSLAFFCCMFVVVQKYPCMAVNATVQSLIGVLALAMAQQIIALISNSAISLMISLSTVIVMSPMSASLDWPGKVACMGVSLSLSGLLQHGPTLGASGSEVFANHRIYCVLVY